MVTLGNPFDTMKRFFSLQPMSPPTKPSDIFPPEGGCSEGLDAFRFFFKIYCNYRIVDDFARRDRPVDDCRPGRGGMAQGGRTRGEKFHGEIDRCGLDFGVYLYFCL